MKSKKYVLNMALAGVLFAVSLGAQLARAFAPAVILPSAQVPNLVQVSLAALLIDHYAARDARRCYVSASLWATPSFGLLPLAAGLVDPIGAVKLGLSGSAVFMVTTALFTSARRRMQPGTVPLTLLALGLYLASLGLAGFAL